jgi:hypothetical protein
MMLAVILGFTSCASCGRIKATLSGGACKIMADEQKTPENTPMTPEEKQAQKKRIMWILGIGFAALFLFYYVANGVTSILTESTAIDPVELQKLNAQ